METERIDISDLACDPANVRAHDSKNLDAINGSLQRFGQQKPIVVDGKGIVIAGNGTLTAARALGWDAINIVRTELAGSEATAYAIADNRTAELAEWDDEALAKQLSALQIEDEALVEAAGFTDAELTALVDEVMGITEGNTDPDEVPEVPEEPTAQLGQIWQLGDHRVMCGDSTSAEDVAALMDGQKASTAFTSPPYASQRSYDEASSFSTIKPDDYVNWFDAVQANVSEHLAPDGSWFVNIKEHCDGGQRSLYVKDLTLAHVRSWNWLFVDEFCWQRVGLPGGYPNRFKNGWEPVFHFCRSPGIKFRPDNVSHDFDSSGAITCDEAVRMGRQTGMTHEGSNGGPGFVKSKNRDRALPSNVLSLSCVERGVNHPAMFPVGLPEFFIKAYSDKGDITYDPFIGSGTTLIACEQTGRKCFGMELSPLYCDVIIKRWEDFTGQTAELVNG